MPRVLVVESREPVRQVLVRILRRSAVDAVGLATPADAISACEPGAEIPKLIVVGCYDPEPAAVVETLLPLRSHPLTSGVPLLVAADDRDVIGEATKLGARECFLRAWANLEDFVECVRRNLADEQ